MSAAGTDLDRAASVAAEASDRIRRLLLDDPRAKRSLSGISMTDPGLADVVGTYDLHGARMVRISTSLVPILSHGDEFMVWFVVDPERLDKPLSDCVMCRSAEEAVKHYHRLLDEAAS